MVIPVGRIKNHFKLHCCHFRKGWMAVLLRRAGGTGSAQVHCACLPHHLLHVPHQYVPRVVIAWYSPHYPWRYHVRFQESLHMCWDGSPQNGLTYIRAEHEMSKGGACHSALAYSCLLLLSLHWPPPKNFAWDIKINELSSIFHCPSAKYVGLCSLCGRVRRIHWAPTAGVIAVLSKQGEEGLNTILFFTRKLLTKTIPFMARSAASLSVDASWPVAAWEWMFENLPAEKEVLWQQ